MEASSFFLMYSRYINLIDILNMDKQQIENWFKNNNGHPFDDERFYKIVIDSVSDKISEDVFIEVMGEEKAIEYYKRYEELRNFLLYVKK